METVGVQTCELCHKEISTISFMMHQLNCSRHNVKCGECNMIISVHEKDSHHLQFNTKVKCDCGMSVFNKDLENHKKVCIHRMSECMFCEMQLRFDELLQHQETCGNRTDICESCGTRILVKQKGVHICEEQMCGTQMRPQMCDPQMSSRVSIPQFGSHLSQTQTQTSRFIQDSDDDVEVDIEESVNYDTHHYETIPPTHIQNDIINISDDDEDYDFSNNNSQRVVGTYTQECPFCMEEFTDVQSHITLMHSEGNGSEHRVTHSEVNRNEMNRYEFNGNEFNRNEMNKSECPFCMEKFADVDLHIVTDHADQLN